MQKQKVRHTITSLSPIGIILAIAVVINFVQLPTINEEVSKHHSALRRYDTADITQLIPSNIETTNNLFIAIGHHAPNAEVVTPRDHQLANVGGDFRARLLAFGRVDSIREKALNQESILNRFDRHDALVAEGVVWDQPGYARMELEGYDNPWELYVNPENDKVEKLIMLDMEEENVWMFIDASLLNNEPSGGTE